MNCIRCGRRIAEGKTFCDECAGVVREPLPDSPYTSLHIALPKRTDQPRPPRKPVEQPEKKKPRSRRYHRMVRAIVSLALVCAVLAGCCAFGVYYYLTHYQRDRNRLRVQAEELASQARDIDRLEQQVNTYQMQGAQNEQSLRELQEENLRLVDENAGYADQVDALNAQLSKLNSRVSTLQDSNAALQQKSAFFDAHVAFVENDGTDYYHNYSCSYFKKQSYWAYSVNLAIARGYTACPYCGG